MQSIKLEIGRFFRLDYAALLCSALVLGMLLARGTG
jgi:hypothetical protein